MRRGHQHFSCLMFLFGLFSGPLLALDIVTLHHHPPWADRHYYCRKNKPDRDQKDGNCWLNRPRIQERSLIWSSHKYRRWNPIRSCCCKNTKSQGIFQLGIDSYSLGFFHLIILFNCDDEMSQPKLSPPIPKSFCFPDFVFLMFHE